MNDYDDVMNRLGNTKPVDQRDPFLSEGQHQLLVHSIQEYNDTTWGKSFRVLFLVEQSTRHPPGSLVARTYNIYKPAAYATQSNDADSLTDFICVLQGIKLGDHHASAKALFVSRERGGQHESQVARGMRVLATGQPPGNGLTAKGKPKTYTRITWQTAPNDAASVSTNRAMLDAKFPIGAPQAPPGSWNSYGPPQQQTAPQALQQMQQHVQPQYAAPLGHTQPQSWGAHNYTPPQPVQPPVQPYTPPQQMPPQGYVQPQFGGQQPVNPQPVQSAPTGGFLAMLPPKQ